MTTGRLLTLLSLLQVRRDWAGQALAERLQVSARTVRRDVGRLRELGYRVVAMKGPDGGYRLEAGAELPPLLFDNEQVIALGVALQTAAVSGAGVEEAALRALTTVRQVMPQRLRHRLDALVVTALPRRTAVLADPDVLVAVSAAIRRQEVLRFDYPASSGAASQDPPLRRVEPHNLVVSDGRWYLVAWDLDRDDWRVYRADRLAPRTPTGPRFIRRELPGGDVRTFVSARFRGSVTADAWPCRGRVIIDLPPDRVAPFVEDGTVEPNGDGRSLVEAGSWSWVALAAWLGRFDASIDVVGPAELVDAFAQLSRRFAAAATGPRG